MRMKHVLLEMYCNCGTNKKEKPTYCSGIGHICIQNSCKYLGCTYCPNEIAFASSNGVVESFDDCIGFGGEMEPETNDLNTRDVLLEKWKDICKKKIDEAYEEYMESKKDAN
jgi:hypothetical protein